MTDPVDVVHTAEPVAGAIDRNRQARQQHVTVQRTVEFALGADAQREFVDSPLGARAQLGLVERALVGQEPREVLEAVAAGVGRLGAERDQIGRDLLDA